jgi:hypothetical protein
MARNFKELQAKISPERRAKTEERVQKAIGEMALNGGWPTSRQVENLGAPSLDSQPWETLTLTRRHSPSLHNLTSPAI